MTARRGRLTETVCRVGRTGALKKPCVTVFIYTGRAAVQSGARNGGEVNSCRQMRFQTRKWNYSRTFKQIRFCIQIVYNFVKILQLQIQI